MSIPMNLPETDFTQFLIFNTGDADGAGIAAADPATYGGGSHDRQFGTNGSKLSSRIWNNETISSAANFNDNTTHIGMLKVENGVGQEIYADGASVATGAKDGSDFNWESGMVIGGHQGWDYLNGDIAEVIMYNKVLNDPERIIVENYLSSKYNVPIPNDYYAYDGSYGHDVTGVGQENGTTHFQARSDSILEILGFPFNMVDGEFMLWGHDNGAYDSWSSANVPNANVQRLPRVWRIDETGDIGAVRFLADTTKFAPRPAGFTKFVLLVDDDGDFSSGTKVYEMNPLGGTPEHYIKSLDPSNSYVTIGVLRPEVEFVTTSSDGFEPTTNPTVDVKLNYIPINAVDVEYTTSDAGATGGATPFGAGTDYESFSGETATINTGDTTTTITLNINNDVTLESDESFNITLSNPSAGIIGPNNTHTYTIHDDDNNRKIYFSVDSANGDEATSPVNVTVELTPAEVDPTNDTKVDYTVTGGSATGGGTDYTLASGTATITATNQSTSFSFTVNDDDLYEADETIEISLSNPVNGNLALPSNNPVTHVYTINDNDVAPEVEFALSSTSETEGVGTASITVMLSKVAGAPVTVDYLDNGSGTATSGTDYSLSNGTLTIPAGDSVGTVDINITDDGDQELVETIGIDIQNPSGATLGTTTSHTFNIVDNDQFGYLGPGGVGNSTSSNNLLIRLKANDGAYQDAGTTLAGDGNTVQEWHDRSGNNLDAIQNTGGSRPTYRANSINGRPTIDFNGSSNFMAITGDVPEANYTQGAVFRTSDGNGALSAVTDAASYTAGSNDRQFGMNGGGNFSSRIWNNETINSAGTYNDGNVHSGVLDVSPSGQALYLDGQADGSGTKTSSDFNWQTHMLIGGHSAWDYYDGDVAEFFLYQVNLNNTQRLIVDNYISAAYGSSLPAARNKYNHDGSHGYEMAGIGRYDSSDFHIDAQSGDILRVYSPLDLDSGEYFMWGHDGAGTASWSNSETPENGIQRLPSEWRIDETGDVGEVTFLADTSNLPAKPSGYSKYVLLVDSDGNFSSGAEVYEMEPAASGGYVSKAGLNPDDDVYVTIGVLRPEIEFVQTNSDGMEPNTSPSFTIRTNYVPLTPITVDYKTSDVSAIGGNTPFTSGEDYESVNWETVTFPAGDTNTTFNLNIHNDTDVESDEDLEITLSNPSSGQIGTRGVHTYTIHDDDNDRKIYFSVDSASGDESVSPVSVTVELTPGEIDPSNNTTVDYTVTGGTATGGGTDYTLASGTATILAGNQSTTFNFTVNDDNIFENDETIDIELSNPVNGNLALPTNNPIKHVYTILDNDTEPEIEFAIASSSGNEGSSPAQVAVKLSNAAGTDITVDYNDNGSGNATPGGTDYTLPPGTITVPAGTTYANIEVIVIDDALEEATETVGIDISNPSGATLGAITSHTLSIIDNDVFGYLGPGGVGNSSTSSNLRVWFRADSNVYRAGGNPAVDGQKVEDWEDLSGNGLHAIQTNGGAKPTLRTNAINGQPVVEFDGNNNWMGITGDVPEAGYTQYAIFRSTDNQGAISAVVDPVDYNAGSHDRQFGFSGSGNFGSRLWSNETINSAATYNDDNVYSAVLDVSSSGQNLAFDATADGSGAKTGSDFNWQSGMVLGGHSAWGYYDGDIAEYFIYQTNLDTAQRIIVDNYLQARYNISLPAGRDKFSYDATYGVDVAGIGRENANNYHVDAQGNVVRINGPLSMNDGDYLLWGHDDASMNNWTTVGIPKDSIIRINRVWRAQETGEVGKVDMLIDTTDLPPKPGEYETYIIMVDRDGDADFTTGDPDIYPLIARQDEYGVADTVAIDDGDHFTIGMGRNRSIRTGDWDIPGTWLTNRVPGNFQSAIISPNDTVSLTSNTQAGRLYIDNNGLLVANSYRFRLNNASIDTIGTGNLDAGTGEVDYANAGAQIIAQLDYHDLTVSNTGVKTLKGDITISNDLYIGTDATLDVDNGNNYNITIAGNWSGGGTFNEHQGTVTFSGTSTQQINKTNGEGFYNLTIDKAGNYVQLVNTTDSVSNTLDLKDGYIDLNRNELFIDNGATGAITRTSGYVVSETSDLAGEVSWNIGNTTGAHEFPFATSGGTYIPFTLDLTAGDIGTVSLATYPTTAINTPYPVTDVDTVTHVKSIATESDISNKVIDRFWNIDKNGPDGTADITFTYDDPGDIPLNGEVNFVGQKWENTGKYWVPPIAGQVQDLANNTVTVPGVTSFSPWTLAPESDPLPIELLEFNAQPDGDVVAISWVTASEQNTDHFTVLRSRNGMAYEEVKKVEAAGNSNSRLEYSAIDPDPYPGISYYKLRSTDLDGSTNESRSVAVEFGTGQAAPGLTVYPNPTRGEVFIQLNGLGNKKVRVTVRDLLGKQYFSEDISTRQGNTTLFNLQKELPAGVYMITATTEETIYKERLVVE